MIWELFALASGGQTLPPPPSDFVCMALFLEAERVMPAGDGRWVMTANQAFFAGRLSVVDPKRDWLTEAATEGRKGHGDDIGLMKSCVQKRANLMMRP